MGTSPFEQIKSAYLANQGDSLALFKTVLSAGKEIGLDVALGFLEDCVIEKRVAWLERQPYELVKTGDPLADGFDLFYKVYLGLAIPQDGEIIYQDQSRIIARWWNRCPTLEACRGLELDTREICAKVYERPVQAMLEKFNPRLHFRRNYQCIRPYQPYCEETIEIEEIDSER